MRRDARGRFCIHKRPRTRFSQPLTFTLTLQHSTLVALFTPHYFCHFLPVSCGDLWPYFSGSFVLFFCHLFLMGLHRVMSLYTCLTVVGLFVVVFFALSFFFYSFVKRETAKFEAISHMITTALFRTGPNLCSGFNPVYRRF